MPSMPRSQIWDGAQWVSMTGGAGDGGGSEPDDNYLRLDGANNNASPNNWLRKVDADILYLDINDPVLLTTGGTMTGSLKIANTGISYTGVTNGGGTTNNIAFTWSGITSSRVTVVVDNNVSYALANNADLAKYLLLTGGTLSGALQLDGGVNNGIVVNSYDGAPASGKDQYWYQLRNIRFKDTSGAPSDSEGKDGDVSISYTFA